MAPEVICRKNHSVAADYFAVGVIVYELMLGRRPYLGKNRSEIREAMLSKQVQVRHPLPGWSAEAADFASQCLQRKAGRRLGSKGPHELKQHPWLADIDWASLLAKRLQAPFIPGDVENFDAKQVMRSWEPTTERPRTTRDLFTGYYYDVNRQPELAPGLLKNMI